MVAFEAGGKGHWSKKQKISRSCKYTTELSVRHEEPKSHKDKWFHYVSNLSEMRSWFISQDSKKEYNPANLVKSLGRELAAQRCAETSELQNCELIACDGLELLNVGQFVPHAGEN